MKIDPELMEASDAVLVNESLTGNREAFGQIVARYQTLLCSLAYSGTGSLNQSEDLAQDTFIAAWKQLAGLREPQKLRSWLCGILRNLTFDALKRQGREPSHGGERLEEISETHSLEPLPTEQAISNEEMALLWRSLERIPEIYREPLVLFYRQHQSVQAVARNLELSEDAVKQRLSRGRKFLQEQVLAFIEGALEKTNPGKTFTLEVLSALPAVSLPSKIAMFGATAAKGTVSAKAAGAMGMFNAGFTTLAVFFGNYVGYRMSLDTAHSDEERRHIKAAYGVVVKFVVFFFFAFLALILWAWRYQKNHMMMFGLLVIGLIVVYILTTFVVVLTTLGGRRRYLAGLVARNDAGDFSRPAYEFRSRWTFWDCHLSISASETASPF